MDREGGRGKTGRNGGRGRTGWNGRKGWQERQQRQERQEGMVPGQLQSFTMGAIGASSEVSVKTPAGVRPRTERMNVLVSSIGSDATLAQKFGQTPSWRRYSSTFD